MNGYNKLRSSELPIKSVWDKFEYKTKSILLFSAQSTDSECKMKDVKSNYRNFRNHCLCSGAQLVDYEMSSIKELIEQSKKLRNEKPGKLAKEHPIFKFLANKALEQSQDLESNYVYLVKDSGLKTELKEDRKYSAFLKAESDSTTMLSRKSNKLMNYGMIKGKLEKGLKSELLLEMYGKELSKFKLLPQVLNQHKSNQNETETIFKVRSSVLSSIDLSIKHDYNLKLYINSFLKRGNLSLSSEINNELSTYLLKFETKFFQPVSKLIQQPDFFPESIAILRNKLIRSNTASNQLEREIYRRLLSEISVYIEPVK